MKIGHILLTSDLSAESLHPCLAVAGLARRSGARITLLHVVPDLKVVPHGAPMAPPITPIDLQGDIARARDVLEEQRTQFGEDLEVHTAVVEGDKTWRGVIEYAEKHDVDLIALSTHGRTGFRHFALGSVAESILRHSRVPVLCFPQPRPR